MDTRRLSFVDAVRHQGPVQGETHALYRYPARFSPVFARSAIETFSAPGDTILDPFVGGGTTMVEARLVGRHALGSDISSLAVFLARSKVDLLSPNHLAEIEKWFVGTARRLNIRKFASNLRQGDFNGYDRNMPWRLRKLCEQYLERLSELKGQRLRRFARCILLRCGQWAMDCRRTIPTVDEFRDRLSQALHTSIEEMRQYCASMMAAKSKYGRLTKFRCVQAAAAELVETSFGNWDPKPKLIVTSPPYPGVHMLYHRWNVRGRRETPAPFWLADCHDGRGAVHYSLGDRRQEGLRDYYAGVQESFAAVWNLLADDGMVVQMVSFSQPDWQVPAYLRSMRNAGFEEVSPVTIGINHKGRLWRSVPGRRWYSAMRGEIPTSRELVLLHRKR